MRELNISDRAIERTDLVGARRENVVSRGSPIESGGRASKFDLNRFIDIFFRKGVLKTALFVLAVLVGVARSDTVARIDWSPTKVVSTISKVISGDAEKDGTDTASELERTDKNVSATPGALFDDPLPIGEPITINNRVRWRVLSFERLGSRLSPIARYYTECVALNGEYARLTFSVENLEEDSSIPLYDIYLFDGSRKRFSQAGNVFGCISDDYTPLIYTELPAESSTQFTVLFDIDPEAEGLRLEVYDPTMGGISTRSKSSLYIWLDQPE